MSNHLKEIFNEFSSTSTLYFLPKFNKSKRLYQKILWILFMIGTTVFTFILFRDNILSFLDYEITTVAQTVYEQPSEFPTVSICAYNDFYFKSKKLKELLLDCYFGYDYSCKDNPNNYFQYFYSQQFGDCFRFNNGKNITNNSIPILNSTIGGQDDSFTFVIDKSKDMVIWIHNRSITPNLEYKNNHYNTRVFAPSNSNTDIKIEKVVEKKLTAPYNQCLRNVSEFKYNKTIIDYILKNDQIYTQLKCLELCFDIDYIKTNPCNCTNVSIGEVWSKCWIKLEYKNMTTCTWTYKKNFYSKHVLDKCSLYCPLECDSISYNIYSTSISNYNSTKVRIYYGSLKYTLLTQSPKMPIYSFVSNIGGILGLFLGFSVVNIFEIIEISFEILIYTLSGLENK